jgi:hypothetical protein
LKELKIHRDVSPARIVDHFLTVEIAISLSDGAGQGG